MTFRCDDVTRAALDAVPDKNQWIDALYNTLGDTRYVRCVRDNNPNAPDPFATGVEFRKVQATGAFTSRSGAIIKLGRLKGTVISSAADMSSGASRLRMQSADGNRWIEGSLGLSKTAQAALGVTAPVEYDFTVERNFTTTNGLGVSTTMTVAGWHLLPSGTGPYAPTLTDDAPASLEIWNWDDPLAPFLVGTIPYDARRDDFVYDDIEMASEIGDVSVYQSSQSVIHGLFEFGSTMLASTHTNSINLDKPRYEVLLYCKPYNQNWDGYPNLLTYDIKVQKTQPTPFKGVLKSRANAVLHTFEMRDGLPINSPQLSQIRDKDHEIRPFFNCAMMLPWQNDLPSTSVFQKFRFNGMDPEVLRPAISKAGDMDNAHFPMISAQLGLNGMLNMWAMPQWAMSFMKGYYIDANGNGQWDQAADLQYGITVDSYNGQNYIGDPNLFLPYGPFGYHDYEGKVYRATGWDYEPGANGGHDWYSAPGGPRFDRAVVPSVIATYFTQNDFVRPKNLVPIKAMVDAWGLTYFNHSTFYITDVKTMTTIDKTEMLLGEWSYNWGYYSVRPMSENGVPAAKCVEISAVLNGTEATDANRDKDGFFPYSGWAPDSLHAYCAPSLWPLFFNSPMHTIAGIHRYSTSKMAALGQAGRTANPFSYFMQRIHAWRWLHETLAWKNSSMHDLGLPRSMIEDNLQADMELIWTNIYKPAMLDVSLDPVLTVYRNLGVQNDFTTDYGFNGITSGAGGLGYYMTHTFVLMKQTGLWDVMKAKSTKCADTMRWMVRNFAMGSVDLVLDAKGRGGGYPQITVGGFADRASIPQSAIPTSWLDWATNFFPANGLEDLIRDSTGAILPSGYEPEVNVHWRAQWPRAHQMYFPEAEYAYPRLAQAVQAYTQFDLDVKANYAAGRSDWHYRYPSQGFLRAAGAIEPLRQ